MPDKYTLKPGQKILVCPQCGIEFVRWRSSLARCCSIACRSAMAKIPIEDRFWQKVDCSGGDRACWPWMGALASNGYGKTSVNRRPVDAHRIAWELTHGPIPAGLYVCHNCPDGDNKRCVNPAHLWLGTPRQNAQDAWDKGSMTNCAASHPDRMARGERHGNAKLTADKIVEIRRRFVKEGESVTSLGRTFGIGHGHIHRIVTGKVWRHV